jgi:hypothetical protein
MGFRIQLFAVIWVNYIKVCYNLLSYLTVNIQTNNFSNSNVKKVKVTLVQALRLCTGRMAHRRSRGIALLFHDHGTSRGWGVSVTSRSLFTPGQDPVPIVQEAGWAPGPVWTGAENLAPTGIRYPDRPARSKSLYRLRYPAHFHTVNVLNSVSDVSISCLWNFPVRGSWICFSSCSWITTSLSTNGVIFAYSRL